MTSGVYKRTAKHKQNISKALKGRSRKGPCISKEGKRKISLAQRNIKGSKRWNWKGGKAIHSDGYVLLLMPEYPFPTRNGYVLRSRLVMEKKIGRYIKPKEIVHHINGIVDDDRPENLQLFPNLGTHTKFHNEKRKLV